MEDLEEKNLKGINLVFGCSFETLLFYAALQDTLS